MSVHHENIVRAKTQIYCIEREETAEEQACARRENKRKRNLGDDE